MANDHNTCDRHALLLNACRDTTINDDQKSLLKKHGIGLSILGGTPKWVQKYAVLLLEYIVYEKNTLPLVLTKKHPDSERYYRGVFAGMYICVCVCKCITIQYTTIQYIPIQYITIQYNTIQYKTKHKSIQFKS